MMMTMTMMMIRAEGGERERSEVASQIRIYLSLTPCPELSLLRRLGIELD